MNESLIERGGRGRTPGPGTDRSRRFSLREDRGGGDIPIPSLSAGLTEAEAERSRTLYGTNAVRPGKRPGFFRRFLASLNDPIIRILLFALAVNTVFSFSGTGWAESVGIAVTVLVSSLVSTLSEQSSGASFEKLYAALGDIRCRILREGSVKTVSAADVVRRDLVVLKPGDTVPADGVLLSGSLRCDESPLTGESRPVGKTASGGVIPSDPAPGGTSSLLRGSHVTEGGGVMLVTAVGESTMYGKIAGELEAEDGVSPLKNRLSALARSISRIGYVSALFVAAVHLADAFWFDAGQNAAVALMRLSDTGFVLRELTHALTLGISILVVAVPEGLPMMITVVLAANMKKMMKHGVLVRRLVGIETAGSVDMLFTDKTGTLTTGSLTVESVLTVKSEAPLSAPAVPVSESRSVLSRRSGKRTGRKSDKASPALIRTPEGPVFLSSPSMGSAPGVTALHLRESASVCSSTGNQTEKALSSFAGFRESKAAVLTPKTGRIPFDSARKFAAGEGANAVLIRGAPELLLPFCVRWKDENGTSHPMDAALRSALERLIREYAASSARLILHAEAERGTIVKLKEGPEGVPLTFAALSVLRDEIRREVPGAVEECRTAGIQTVMITGDNADTAEAVARSCGILPRGGVRLSDPDRIPAGDDPVVLEGAVLRALPDEKVSELLPRIAVISRVTPTDKSRLVRLAQQKGHIVGMTGDGINDAPALKAADVGFAMGSGADVAREAGDIVITDDNFVSVTRAVLYGRTIFSSIRKFITYQLTMNLAAVGVSVLGTMLGIENPVTVIQMLWVNMIMDTLGSLAFAGEPALEDVMRLPPVKRNEPILTRSMAAQTVLTGGFALTLSMVFLLSPGLRLLFPGNRLHRLTQFFALFVFMGIVIAFTTRTPRINLFAHLTENRAFCLIMPAVAVMQLLIVWFGGEVFRCVPLPPAELGRCALLALLVVPLDTVRKCVLRILEERKRTAPADARTV